MIFLNEYEYHVQLASPASPASPAQPSPAQPSHSYSSENFARARSIELLKNDRKVICVSQCLHKEIDEFRFSWPEQFSAGAPLILLLFAKVIFRRRFDRFPMPRSIEALKNDRKIIRVSLCLHKEIDAFRFSGPEQFSADAPLILLLFAKIIFRRRFDRFRSFDRSRR